MVVATSLHVVERGAGRDGLGAHVQRFVVAAEHGFAGLAAAALRPGPNERQDLRAARLGQRGQVDRRARAPEAVHAVQHAGRQPRQHGGDDGAGGLEGVRGGLHRVAHFRV
ncbi:hypothetical protein G6F52_013970 [Rhizopus delemar]|nr:hypothetical protein G6F52_013970 [Rhizopus delemar]